MALLSGGDYLFHQLNNLRFSVDIDLSGAAVGATLAQAVRDANHQIFVQRIVLSFITHVATKIFTVQDDTGTPVPIASRTDLAAAAGVPDVVTWDFGPVGTALAVGKNLKYLANTGGTGFTARVHIEGYQRLGATISASVAS